MELLENTIEYEAQVAEVIAQQRRGERAENTCIGTRIVERPRREYWYITPWHAVPIPDTWVIEQVCVRPDTTRPPKCPRLGEAEQVCMTINTLSGRRCACKIAESSP